MIEQDDEVPPVPLYFSKRAKLVATVTAEQLRATKELMNAIQGPKTEAPLSKNAVLQPTTEASKESLRRSERQKKASPRPEENTEENAWEGVTASPEVTLSAAAKRRLKKLQKQEDLELQKLDAENQKIFSEIKSSEHDQDEEVPFESFERVIVLTVSYLADVSRLKCYECDNFSSIFPKVGELFNLKVSEFLLSFREQIIKIEDTPKSLNITDSDILECIPYKSEESCEAGIHHDSNHLKIIFQANDSKKKINMLVHKLEKMQDIMEKYSKQRDIPLKLLIFEFDGDRISGTETPEDLDMESGNCIDVRVSTSSEKKTKKSKPEILVTLDSGSSDSDLYIDCE